MQAVFRLLSLSKKTLSLSKIFFVLKKGGVWGIAPSGVRAAAPHSPPFLGKGGRGIGIENLLYFYKYRLFLQSGQAVFRLLFF